MPQPVDDIDPLTGALTTLPDTACGKTFPDRYCRSGSHS
jgi:hypothetical protein